MLTYHWICVLKSSKGQFELGCQHEYQQINRDDRFSMLSSLLDSVNHFVMYCYFGDDYILN